MGTYFPRAVFTYSFYAARPFYFPPMRARVLVVDDYAGVRLLVDEVLSDEGYDVIPAEGPDQALALFARDRGSFDLLVTDVSMPRMSGTDLARQLRDRAGALRVLYMSGMSRDVIDLDAGARFLAKPFEPGDLVREVHAILAPRGGQ